MKVMTATYLRNVSDGWGVGDDVVSIPRGYRLLHAKMVAGLAEHSDIFGQYTATRPDDGYNWIECRTGEVQGNYEEVHVTAPKWVWDLVKG